MLQELNLEIKVQKHINKIIESSWSKVSFHSFQNFHPNEDKKMVVSFSISPSGILQKPNRDRCRAFSHPQMPCTELEQQ